MISCADLVRRAGLLALSTGLAAQVYSPVVLQRSQPDPTDLRRLASGICANARAITPREKAQAIWRFFLTDGRFVKPGFWYHIAGWAYEEPRGEVLDPLKLLNSYGFGLCYHIAPLLEAVFDAAGFEDSRVWFLTGHTVAEVFYDGAYHYYDSDMMGYTTLGHGPPQTAVVASVHQIERDGALLTGKLKSSREVNPELVDTPWYPADVREGAIEGMADLFTTTKDNWLYAFKRYPEGHTMNSVLRPGERMIRYFRPEDPHVFYLPYAFDGKNWREFPQEIARYRIRTEDGPHSQKDARLWSTGRIEYEPDLSGAASSVVIDMPSPYVIIDASAAMRLNLAAGQNLDAATSVDGGDSWQEAGRVTGPYAGWYRVEPATIARSEHGRRTAVSGTYGYKLKLTRTGGEISAVRITTRFEVNPRTLPALSLGQNHLLYSAGAAERWNPVPVRLDQLSDATNTHYVSENGQGLILPRGGDDAFLLFEIAAQDHSRLLGFRAGGRFLDIRDRLVPDKLTAEVRKTAVSIPPAIQPAASIEWSPDREGPYRRLWSYDPHIAWRDGQPIDRLLRWPEVDRTVRSIPAGTARVWVRYRLRGMALDDVRLTAIEAAEGNSPLEIAHLWKQGGVSHEHHETIAAGSAKAGYDIAIGGSLPVENEALILSCPRTASKE